MKTSFALSVLSFFYTHCIAASVDIWSSPIKERAALKYEAIEPEVVKARIGTTPDENSEGGRESGMVYFCREENWGAPCFAYHPDLEYTCNELGPELKGHIGSVFVDPGMICRLAGFNNDRCAPIKIFAWPETQHGWPDLFHQNAPGGSIKLGAATTHFACAECTNCVEKSG
ncbi:Tox1 [Fusarium mexicanum]|uniref:Tox1 n=1 Tax=Fusarium mexicanum TaxID=751941 RepID=A0A8H5J8P8_9HYPO|nr:Tox1 [Fusarium mexicanum]